MPEPEPIPDQPIITDDIKTTMDLKYRNSTLTREDIDVFINYIEQSVSETDVSVRLNFIADKYYDADSERDYAKYYIELKRLYRDIQM